MEGEFLDDHLNGFGLFVSKDLEYYVGDFKNDKFEGEGIYRDSLDDTFRG